MSSDTLRIVQLTDMHLYEDTARDLLGVPTEQSFLDTLNQARRDHWPADCVLATGDLVHDYSPAAYRRLRGHFQALALPVHCLPGNHDDLELMREHLAGGNVQLTSCVDRAAWRLVLLDSTVPRSDGGHLACAQLEHLDTQLAGADGRHALVCVHHNPVPVGSPWLDTMMIDNGAALFDILDRYTTVRGLLWGHVHQHFDILRRGVRLLATPSTCIQFKPQSAAFALDDAPPGYRWLHLHADGRIDTGIARLENYSATLDRNSLGY